MPDITLTYGCSQTDYIHEIITDDEGSIYSIGGFYDTLYYDSTYLSTENYLDMYIMKRNSEDGVNQWVRNFGGPIWDMAIDICFSPDQEFIYITGFFEQYVNFDSIELYSYGEIDIFLLKMSVEGELIWAQNAGGYNNDYGYGIVTDQSGNIYLTGKFESLDITFASHTISNKNNASENYLAKYDPDGNVIWVKSFGGYGWDSSNDLAINSSGQIYICGEYDLEASFDTIQVIGSYGDLFIAKYDPDGNATDVYTAGGIGTAEVYSIAIDQGDNIYVTGLFTEDISFGNHTIQSIGIEDFYVSKINPLGYFEWVESAGGDMFNCGYDVCVGAADIIYCTGALVGTMHIGDTTIQSLGFSDAFLATYNIDGTLLNIQTVGGSDNDYGDDGRTLSWNGESLIWGGRFTNSIVLDNKQFISHGGRDVFMVSIHEVISGIHPEPGSENAVTVYPNPSHGSITVKLNNIVTDNVQVYLHNSIGQLIIMKSIKITRYGHFELSLGNIHPGIYQLTIVGNKNGYKSTKILVY
ncbi:SBBP repeat-containing protein [Bacteroidota bacterium]